MSSIITPLTDRMIAATARRIMAAALARPAQEGSPNLRTKKNLAAAERLVNEALRKAAISDSPTKIILSQELFQNPLTAGIVKRGKEDVIAHVRQLFFKRHPQGKFIRELEEQLENGRTVEPEKPALARAIFYQLKRKETSQTTRIDNYLLNEFFGNSFPRALIECFPLFGLIREDFSVLDWSTEEKAIRNIRHKIFKRYPKLREKIEAIEAAPDDGRLPDDSRLKRMNRTRHKLAAIFNTKNLPEIGLASCIKCPHFAGLREALEKSFPFVKNPIFDRFIDIFDCASANDLSRAYEHIKARRKFSRARMFREKEVRVIGPAGEAYTLRDLYSKFKRYLIEKSETGRPYRRCGRQPSEKEFFDLFLLLIADRKETQAKVRADLRRTKKVLGHVSEDAVKLNSVFISKYGPGIIKDLFGVDCADFISKL